MRPTVKITIETSQEVYRLLGELAETGKFGTDENAVAEELLRAKLREVELDGWPHRGPMGAATMLRRDVERR
jgi:hypothetical protein